MYINYIIIPVSKEQHVIAHRGTSVPALFKPVMSLYTFARVVSDENFRFPVDCTTLKLESGK